MSDVSKYVFDALEKARTATEPQRREALRQERERDFAIRALGGSAGNPLYLNIIGRSAELMLLRGEAASEALEHELWAEEHGAASRYEGTIQINPDGTWEYVNFVDATPWPVP